MSRLLGLGLALFFIPQISLAVDDHISQAIEHTNQAIDDGKHGRADGTHAEAALTHAEASEKAKSNPQTFEGSDRRGQARPCRCRNDSCRSSAEPFTTGYVDQGGAH
jgi:hypothetical protein